MNNGVNNNSNQENPVLMPMEGVKIAPVQDGPVDASSKEGATSANNKSNVLNSPVTQPTVAAVTQPATPVVQNSIPTPEIKLEQPQQVQPQTTEDPKKKKKSIVPLLLLIIIGLVAYIVFSSQSHKNQINNLTYNCTPITASKEDKKLELNSTLVKDLYSKVQTNIREDLAQPEFNDNMKLYLAFRQITDKDIYDSNCNLFSKTAMEPYTCEVSTKFKPKAFKEETLQQEIKKMYGEKTEIKFENIRLGEHSCIGGYQYIPKRGEFVQGLCNSNTATSFKVDKALKEAVSNRNTIILTEEVKYHEGEKMHLPETLKSGLYYYTFRLDMNYNYVLVSKTFNTKY